MNLSVDERDRRHTLKSAGYAAAHRRRDDRASAAAYCQRGTDYRGGVRIARDRRAPLLLGRAGADLSAQHEAPAAGIEGIAAMHRREIVP